MKPYQKYKSSNIPLVDKVPSHWVKKKLKHIGNLYSGLSGKAGEDFYNEEHPNSKRYINFKNIANNIKINPNQFDWVIINENEQQNAVKKGDIFFLMSSENFEDIGRTSVLSLDMADTFLNSFCRGFRLFSNENDPVFLNYLLLSNDYRQNMSMEAKGFTRINIQVGKISNFQILIPNIKEEQTQIARYLDYQTNIIDQLISKKEKLIALLKEQRQAVINEAVTKGLNPNAKMKDSAIEWLGEIPEGWDVLPFKRIAKIKNGKDYRLYEIEEGGYPVVGTGGEFSRASIFLYNKPSVLLGRKGTVDKPQYIDIPFWTVDTLFYTEIHKNHPKYVYYLTQQIPFSLLQESSAVPSMTQENLNNVILCLPTYSEQEKIANYIDLRLDMFDRITSTCKIQIEKLKEYRQSIISEAVTGKIDVRDWEPPKEIKN